MKIPAAGKETLEVLCGKSALSQILGGSMRIRKQLDMNEDSDQKPAPLPLSRPLKVTAIPIEGLDVVIEANEGERAALATENGLVAVANLLARLHVSRSGSQGAEVSGQLKAKVVQTCILTLENFEAAVEEPVHMRFSPPAGSSLALPGARRQPKSDPGDKRGRKSPPPHEEETSAAHHIVDIDADAPDPLIGGEIDLGAVICEFFALGLDPYPRKPGAVFVEPEKPDPDANPFAALRQIDAKKRDR
jgi:hypothetical protein